MALSPPVSILARSGVSGCVGGLFFDSGNVVVGERGGKLLSGIPCVLRRPGVYMDDHSGYYARYNCIPRGILKFPPYLFQSYGDLVSNVLGF